LRGGQPRCRQVPLVEPSDVPGRSAYGEAVTRSQTGVKSHHLDMICVHMHFVKRRLRSTVTIRYDSSRPIPPKTPLPKGGCCRTLSNDNGAFDRKNFCLKRNFGGRYREEHRAPGGPTAVNGGPGLIAVLRTLAE
jgi:hypothetical protein